jgi:hypothetical protein
MRHLDFTDKELVSLYMLLKEGRCPDDMARVQLEAKVQNILFEFMTIEEVEHLDDYYRSL